MNQLLLLGLCLFSLNAQASWKLTFSDEFNAASIDTSKWQTAYRYGVQSQPGNAELECYTKEAVTLEKGNLVITATKKDVPNCFVANSTYKTMPYQSGIINTNTGFSQLFGYFEVRAKMPFGKGLWPAFWLLPMKQQWPPEIDVFEFLMDNPTNLNSTVHWLGADGTHKALGVKEPVQDVSADFHTYGVDWQKDLLIFYVDGQEVGRSRGTEFNNTLPMYPLINLAVGGNWGGNPDANTVFPARMEVDYIRIFQRVADGVDTTLPPVNLVSDGGFEYGSGSWKFTTGPTGSATVSASEAYEGAKAVSLVGLGKATQAISGLKENSTYELSAMVRSANASTITLGAEKFGNQYNTYATSNSTVYKKISLTFKTGTGVSGTSGNVFVYLPTGVASADNITLKFISKNDPELIPNGNFESGLTSWVTNTGTTPVTLTTESYEGKYTAALPKGSILTRVITGLRPNTTYKLMAALYSDDPTVWIQMRANEYDAANNTKYAANMEKAYRNISLQFTTGPGKTSARVSVSSLGASGKADKFSLVEVSKPNILANTNPNFEDGKVGGWMYNATAPASIDIVSDASNGVKAAKLNGVSGVFQRLTGLKSNTTYTLTASLKSVSGHLVALGAKEFNGVNAATSTKLTTYQNLKVVFTTGSGEAGTKAIIYGYMGYADGSAIVDNFTLTEGSN